MNSVKMVMKLFRQYLPCIAVTLLVAIVSEHCRAQDSADVAKVIVPFVEKHWVKCHGAEKPKAVLSLHTFKDTKAILRERKLWDAALHQIESGEMPPAKQPQPTAAEKTAFANNIRALYTKVDVGKPDPGEILIRRLTRTEYLLGKLKSVKEGSGTLLDHCLVCYGSALSDGNGHSRSNLPILLAGNAGGTVQTGRHIRYAADTPLNNLWLSMLQRVDIRVPFLGDSTGALRGLEG